MSSGLVPILRPLIGDCRALSSGARRSWAVSLYGADFVKGVPEGSYPFSRPSVSLFDLAARFFAPTCTSASPARAEAVKDGRFSAHRRLVLEGFEHDGTLERVGDDDVRGELRIGARTSCHMLVRGGPKTQTMMQGYASAASSCTSSTRLQEGSAAGEHAE